MQKEAMETDQVQLAGNLLLQKDLVQVIEVKVLLGQEEVNLNE